DELLARLRSIREQRFKFEVDKKSELTRDDSEVIREIVNAEVYLIFGIGIIGHYESRKSLSGLEDEVLDLLFCGKTPKAWLEDHPTCLQEYFTDERIFFVIAFLLHGLYPDFYRSSVAMGMKQQLDAEVDHFKKEFKVKLRDSPGADKSRTR